MTVAAGRAGKKGDVCSLTCVLTVVKSHTLQRLLGAGEVGWKGGGRDQAHICPIPAGVGHPKLTIRKLQSCPKTAQRFDWLRAVRVPGFFSSQPKHPQKIGRIILDQMIDDFKIRHFKKKPPPFETLCINEYFCWLKTAFLSDQIINWKILFPPKCPDSAVKYY